jgi:hypothetical protein
MGFFRSRAVDSAGNELVRRGRSGLGAGLISLLALGFSGFTLYDGSLKRPDLRAYVPPLIYYASANPRSPWELFEIPVTLVNLGARQGTVVTMHLTVINPRNNNEKRFYAGGFGHFPGVNAEFPNFQPFAPISEAGKASSSVPVLFYARGGETVKQIIEEKGLYRFRLTIEAAETRDLGPLDAYLRSKPPVLEFEMEAPEKDFRVFDKGSEELHLPGEGPVSGEAAVAQEDTAAQTQPTEAEVAEACAGAAPGAVISKTGVDLKAGTSTSTEIHCPGKTK